MATETQKAFLRDMVKVLKEHGYDDADEVLSARDEDSRGGCDTCWYFYVKGEYRTKTGAVREYSVDGSLDTFLYQLIDL